MGKEKEKRQIWVHEDFKELLKIKSAKERVPVVELTKAIKDFELDPLKMGKRRR